MSEKNLADPSQEVASRNGADATPDSPCTYIMPEPQPRVCSPGAKDTAEPGIQDSHSHDVESDAPTQAGGGQDAGPQRQDLQGLPAQDTGAAAWLVVLGAWCCSFCSYGWVNSVGTFQAYYERGPLSNYSPSTIAWIPSLQIFFISFMGPVFGSYFDRYGPRNLVLLGTFLHVFGLMMASVSTEYYQFLLSQGVCSAMGAAAVFISAIACVSGWFQRRRGLAFGVLATGSSIGGVVFPLMLNKLIDTVGYGWAMRASAFIILGMLIVANLTLRMHHPPIPMSLSRKMLGRPFREVPFVLLLSGLAFVPFGLYVPIDYIPTVALRTGASHDLSQNLVAFYNAASLVGRLSSGYLADTLGRFNVFITACYVSGILIVAMWIPASGIPTEIAFTVLFGIFSGAYISLMAALVAEISPIEEIGYRNGIATLTSSIGGLLTNPIAGAIIDRPNGITGLKAFAGAFMLAGTTGILMSRFAVTGMKFKIAI